MDEVLMVSVGRGWMPWLGAGILLSAAGCVVSDEGGSSGRKGDRPVSDAQLHGSKTALLRADSCTDLLSKIQDDAIAKLDLSVARAKEALAHGGDDVGGAGVDFDEPATQPGSGTETSGASRPIAGAPPSSVTAPVPGPAPAGGTVGGSGSSMGPINTPTSPAGPTVSEEAPRDGVAVGDSKNPIGSSDTNTQVEGVDEADFIKMVDSGRGMFLLHGSSLRKLKTYPAEQLSLEPAELKIEGSPSELFVTDDGRAVIFSSVYGYSGFGGEIGAGGGDSIAPCTPNFCGGKGGGYGNLTKITVADVSGATLTTLRELYYQGGYVSSRRYDDVVRVVLQAQSSFSNLYEPEADVSDPWGRPYPQAEIDLQLDQWRDRVTASIRNTKLGDWVPQAKEVKNGVLVDVAPDCGSYFVPQPGLADSGIVHVLALDVSKPDAPVGGVTIMGQASTVYSSLDRLVLAQPDYRWLSEGRDFGFIDEQRTSLHVFSLAGGATNYLASGFAPGHLPLQNAQFGLDVAEDHTLRIATTGRVRKNPSAQQNEPGFWETATENLVLSLQQEGQELKVVGKSDPLGHEGESVQSARFVGDRGYVVTFRQTDPLIVLDVSNAKEPVVIGQIEIPGFSQYVHPLDADHLITFGRSASNGSQLQLFDVSDPLHIPQPKTLDFGGGSSSETANNHKAFTFYAPQSLIALPVSGTRQTNGQYGYMTALRVIRVDVAKGFELLGSIDQSGFANAQAGCYSCGSWGCSNVCGVGASEVRRGHFVEDDQSTYVYAIGYGGVSVSELSDLKTPLVEVTLPISAESSGPWHTSGNGPVGGGTMGTTPVGGAVALPPAGKPTPSMPTPTVSGTTTPVPDGARDPGTPSKEPEAQDAGAAVAVDAG